MYCTTLVLICKYIRVSEKSGYVLYHPGNEYISIRVQRSQVRVPPWSKYKIVEKQTYKKRLKEISAFLLIITCKFKRKNLK